MADQYEDPLKGYSLPAPDVDTSMGPVEFAKKGAALLPSGAGWLNENFNPTKIAYAMGHGGARAVDEGDKLGMGLSAAGLLTAIPGIPAFVPKVTAKAGPSLMGPSATHRTMATMSEAMPSEALKGHMYNPVTQKSIANAPANVRNQWEREALGAFALPGKPDPAFDVLGIPSITAAQRGTGSYRGQNNVMQRIDSYGGDGPAEVAKVRAAQHIKELLQGQNAVPSLTETALPGTVAQRAVRLQERLTPEQFAELSGQGLAPIDTHPSMSDILYWGDNPGDVYKGLAGLRDGPLPVNMAEDLNPNRMGSIYNTANETAMDVLGPMEGQGHLTRHFLGSMQPQVLRSMDASQELRDAAGRIADVDEGLLGTGQHTTLGYRPRRDMQNLRRIFQMGGTEGLEGALRRGVALPAAAGTAVGVGAFTSGDEEEPRG